MADLDEKGLAAAVLVHQTKTGKKQADLTSAIIRAYLDATPPVAVTGERHQDLLRIHQTILEQINSGIVVPRYPETWSKWAMTILEAAATIDALSGQREPNAPTDLSPGLLAKIGSIVGHAQELRSPDGNDVFDGGAIDALLTDAQVLQWLAEMREMALVPQPRTAPTEGEGA